MAEPAISEHRQADGFVSELEARNLHPLWDRYQRITPIKPQAQDAPFLWRWREVEPFLHRSVAEVSINDIERRALILAHPAFATDTTTTSTLLAAFTVLDPGDRARPHRHTGAAIRFATRAEGAVTIVNGRRCKMQEGDLILTPPMVWHGHINESDHRIIWFDAANMPLIRAVDAHFFEPGDPRNNQFWQVDEGEEALWTEAGLVAEGAAASRVNSPKYRYSGETTRRLLAAAPAGSDGARTIRYVNPSTGGAVMPTLDCYAARLTRGTATRLKRATYNVVCLIVRGEGRSHIGDQTLEWSQHDVFTIPHWTWARHEPQNGDADLFMVTDKSAFERLDLVREELQ
jgi:gentisate 1,2-dioxygenase